MYAHLVQCFISGAKREESFPFTSISKDKYILQSILNMLITYWGLLVINLAKFALNYSVQYIF